MSQQPDSRTTVLLIHSNATERAFWAHELKRVSSDYAIVEASDMQSGLSLYQSRRFDCVVLELSLPDQAGFKILIELVPRASRPHIAVIVLTQITVPGVWEIARRNGASACLVKQYTSGESLHHAIQRAIACVGQLPKEDRRRFTSPLLRLGTASWTYPGWQGQVYTPQSSKSRFKRECLGEYCTYQYRGEPLFRTVGNDSGFCHPPTTNHLRHYLNQIPDDFDMCFKVWDQLTIPRFVNHPRNGVWAGQPNARFLDAQLFQDLVLRPFREAQFEPHTGPFLFEFPPHGLSVEAFCDRLDAFLGQLPTDFRYAVECRNSGLLCPRYQNTLAKHGVAHVYTHWSYMPPLLDQHQTLGTFTAPFTVLRLHTPLKMSYEAAKKRAEPYTKMVEEAPQMRRETVHLVQQAVTEGRRTYVLVNNRAEGNAPSTVQALLDLMHLIPNC